MSTTTTTTPDRLRILVTTEATRRRDVFFPQATMAALEEFGDVEYHSGARPLTPEELRDRLPGIDVCVTHWGCPAFTPEVLQGADRLKLIAHAGGSVGDLVTPAVFDRGITVTTANSAMSVNVAEGVLAYILADLQRLVERAQLMRAGGWLQPEDRPTASVSDLTIGLVGFGGIARRLVELLTPLAPRILVSDPYAVRDASAAGVVEFTSLERVLRESDVVTLHASLTAETLGMIDACSLALIRDGALLVNTARSGLIDGAALEKELASGRIRAVLDVFDIEPLSADSALRLMPNVTVMPHAAGSPGSAGHADLIVEEVTRFAHDEPPLHPVSAERFVGMTRDSLQWAQNQNPRTALTQEVS